MYKKITYTFIYFRAQKQEIKTTEEIDYNLGLLTVIVYN